MGLGKTYSTDYLVDSNGNTGVAGQILVTTATGVSWQDAENTGDNQTQGSLFDSKIVLIDTPNGGLKTYRVITDEYGEWIQVGRFAANAMTTIQGTWSSVSGLSTGIAQSETTEFSADFGDSFPTEVRVVGATDFNNWRNTRTIDWIYKSPEGRKWKYFFSGGAENGMTQVPLVGAGTRWGWTVNGAYDGFGRWTNATLANIGMSDSNPTNPSAAYSTATANAFNWDAASDAKLTVNAYATYSGQDEGTTSGVGSDDATNYFFDSYPTQTSNGVPGGTEFSSAVWVLIKLPGGASGSGGGGGGYWAANGLDIYNTNADNVGIGTSSPGDKLNVEGNILLGTTDKIGWRYSSGNTSYNFITGEDQILTLSGGIWTSSGTQTAVRIKTQQGEKLTIRNNGDVGIGTTSPATRLDLGSTSAGGMQFLYDSSQAYRHQILNYWNSSTDSRMDFNIGRTANVAPVTIMSVGYAGNVGIGTTTPSEKLEVDGNVQIGSTTDAKLYMVSTGGNGNNERFFIEGYAYGGTYGGGFKLSTRNSSNVFNTAVTVDGIGNVGIGNTGPYTKLLVGSRGTASIISPPAIDGLAFDFYNEGDPYKRHGVIISQSGDASESVLDFNTKAASGTNSTKMTILGNGNVGIGTISPSSALEVSGRISGGELGNPKITRDDLNFYVDFNDKSCVSGQNVTEAPIDLGPNNYDLTLSGGANFEYLGGIGTFYFDGNADHISINNFNNLSSTSNTYEVWHYANSQNGWETMWDSGNERPLLGTFNDDLRAYPNATEFGTVDTGKWYHFVWAFASDSDLDVYVNGVRVAEAVNWGSSQRLGVFQAWLGGDGSAETTDGYISIARAYTRQLTPADVLQNYNAEVGMFATQTPSLGIVQAGGNVGIGGATQTNRKLKVHGHTLVDGNMYVSGALDTYSIEVGQSRSTEGVAFLDLTGEVTPDDYGLRMIRYGGLNAESKIVHTGTANLTINAENGGDTVFTNTNVVIGSSVANPVASTSPAALTLRKFSSGTASTTISDSYYLGVGGNEYTIDSYRLIGFGYSEVDTSSTYPAYIGYQEKSVSGYTYGDLIFATRSTTGAADNPVERMRIDSAGNVGIGVTSPNAKLFIQYPDATTNTVLRTKLDAAYSMGISNDWVSTYVSKLRLGRVGASTDVSSMEFIYDIQGTEYGSIKRNYTASSLKFERGTTVDMIINGSGNVGIGVTSIPNDTKLKVDGKIASESLRLIDSSATTYLNVGPYQSQAYFYGYQSGNTIHFGQPATFVQNIQVQGTATATNFILSSDKTLKNNIKEIDTNHIDVNWKNFELKSEPGVKRAGVIAQELEEKHPEFVRTDDEGIKSVAYIDLLITKIAELEARLEKAGI